MSNEDLPQSDELASAYLDGELDGSQRAAAAADPSVMAAVDSFTRVRAALGDVVTVDPGAKDAAIAAALAEFDARTATASPVAAAATTAPVVSLQSRRHRAYRIATGAAAAAILVVVAIAAINSGGGSNNDAASSATEAPALAASSPELKSADAATEAAPPEAPVASDAGSAAGSDDATSVPIIDTEQALTEYAATKEIAATTAAPAGAAAPAATSAAADTVAAGSPSAQLTPAPGNFASVACLVPDQILLGAIVWQGTPAVAVRNTTTGALLVIADTDCRVLEEVASP